MVSNFYLGYPKQTCLVALKTYEFSAWVNGMSQLGFNVGVNGLQDCIVKQDVATSFYFSFWFKVSNT